MNLGEIEELCNIFYGARYEEERQRAEEELISLQSSIDFIPQAQYILDNSKNTYALFLASSSLKTLISTYWNNFSPLQRNEFR